MVNQIKTDAEFQQLLKDNTKVAVDFTATWCGPCKMIGPIFVKLNEQYPEILFIKVDVDENSETAENQGVSAMPTFKFFLNGEIKADLEVVGASEAKLKASLDKLKIHQQPQQYQQQQYQHHQSQDGHSFQRHHNHHHQQRQQQHQQPQSTYAAAIPVLLDSAGLASFYKQVNIIPGLDANNALVDTGVHAVRPIGSQVQVSSNTAAANNDFDGKRMRRSIQRRTVDYNASMLQTVKHRLYKKTMLQKPVIQPDPLYYPEIIQPRCILDNPINSVTTRFVRASTNKIRCPVFTVAWTPEGRRVVTGTSSGEFTLWNGLTFNFETILQAHESAVRAMEWSHNDMWLLSGDHNGVIKYWQSNMNNVKMIQAHTDPVRGLSFCPTDNKFVTCSDDGLVKVWDFYRCVEEKALRGHGADVKCVAWHPFKCMVASGSKDSQQPLKLWDPKSGNSLATIHGHKSTVMGLDWNKNGNWLLTGSRDRLVKVFDIRVMKEIHTFRGHKKEAASVNWHPLYEEMFASGGSDGSIMFWLLGCEKELGCIDHAHDGMIWDIKWHPLGHILCSGSNDHTTKFWTRNRPGDKMRDKYNLNILPSGFDDDYEYELPNTSQSETDTSILDSSRLNSSLLSTSTPSKHTLDKSDFESPIVKALLEQNSLEVVKSQVTETPAEIFTVSQLRPTAPVFKIDSKKQIKAIEDVETIEKKREKMLWKGDEKSNKRRRVSNHDDIAAVNAPSLLDINITAPAFLKDHEWGDDSEPPPFIADLKTMAAEKNPESVNTNLFSALSSNMNTNPNINNMTTESGFTLPGRPPNNNNIPTNNPPPQPSGFSNVPVNNIPGNFPPGNQNNFIRPPNDFNGLRPNFPMNGHPPRNLPPPPQGGQNGVSNFNNNRPPEHFQENQRRFDVPRQQGAPQQQGPPRQPLPPGPPPMRPPMIEQQPPPMRHEFNIRPPNAQERFNIRPQGNDGNFFRMNAPQQQNHEQFQPPQMPHPPRRPNEPHFNDSNRNHSVNGNNQGPPPQSSSFPPEKQWDGKERWKSDEHDFRRNDMRR